MMQLQTYLRRAGSLGIELLAEAYTIKAKRHTKYNHLVQFKYDQIESPMGEPIVQECRGVILDENNDWAVVARAFDKFFNYGEGHAPEIDWATAKVQEKLDGSLIIMYYYDDQWHAATSGTPDASGSVHGFDFTFAELFKKAWGNTVSTKLSMGGLWNFTYLFELTSQYNRVIVPHTEPRATLIGIRHKDGTEYPPEHWLNPGFPIPKTFGLQNIADVMETFQSFQPTTQEGYVVVDKAFRRIKVKHPGYVALHHLKDGFGTRRMLEIVRQGEISEVITHFPEYKEEFEAIKEKFEWLHTDIVMNYGRLQHIVEQKAFALEAVKTKCPGALFALRAGQVGSAKAFLRDKLSIENLMLTLGLKTDIKGRIQGVL